jgi:hypothetical protein
VKHSLTRIVGKIECHENFYFLVIIITNAILATFTIISIITYITRIKSHIESILQPLAPTPAPIPEPVSILEPVPISPPAPIPVPAPIPEPVPISPPAPIPAPAPISEPVPISPPAPIPAPAPIPEPVPISPPIAPQMPSVNIL